LEGVDSSGFTALGAAISKRQVEVAQYLKNVGAKLDINLTSTFLSEACAEGDVILVKLLLSMGVDSNLNPPGKKNLSRIGRSAAHMAADNDHLECMQMLLKKWADVNVVDDIGCTPLDGAIRGNSVLMLQLIVKAGGIVNTEEFMLSSAEKGDIESVRMYCENGANINTTNYFGRTMFNLACSNKHPAVVDYLLGMSNINLSPIDLFGGTPLDDTLREKHSGIAVTLREIGAKAGDHASLVGDHEKIDQRRRTELLKM
jgi:ankyrin repeat protein